MVFPTVPAWLELLSWIKAIFDAAELGVDVNKAYDKYKKSSDTQQEAVRISSEFYSTFSEAEVQAMADSVKRCQQRFIEQQDGEGRVKCLCSILEQAKIGNGGTLPHIDDWERIYNQLCANNKKKRG